MNFSSYRINTSTEPGRIQMDCFLSRPPAPEHTPKTPTQAPLRAERSDLYPAPLGQNAPRSADGPAEGRHKAPFAPAQDLNASTTPGRTLRVLPTDRPKAGTRVLPTDRPKAGTRLH